MPIYWVFLLEHGRKACRCRTSNFAEQRKYVLLSRSLTNQVALRLEEVLRNLVFVGNKDS